MLIQRPTAGTTKPFGTHGALHAVLGHTLLVVLGDFVHVEGVLPPELPGEKMVEIWLNFAKIGLKSVHLNLMIK